MFVRTARIYTFFLLFSLFTTNVELRFVPNDTGHFDINQTQADFSCILLNNYNFKDSLDLIFNSVYYSRLSEALKLFQFNFNSDSAKNKLSKFSLKPVSGKTLEGVNRKFVARAKIKDEI